MCGWWCFWTLLKFLLLELFGCCCLCEVFFILQCVVDGVSEFFWNSSFWNHLVVVVFLKSFLSWNVFLNSSVFWNVLFRCQVPLDSHQGLLPATDDTCHTIVVREIVREGVHCHLCPILCLAMVSLVDDTWGGKVMASVTIEIQDF